MTTSSPAAGAESRSAPTVDRAPSMTPPMTPSLRVNAAWTLVGRGVYYACQFGMLAILAAAGSPAVVGEFVFAMAVSTPAFTLANLQLHVVQCTDRRGEFSFSDFLRLRLVTTLATFLLIAAAATALAASAAEAWAIIAVAAAKGVESLSDLYGGRLQKHERLADAARSLMLRGFLALAAFAAVYPATHSLAWAALAMTVAWAAAVALYDVRLVRRLPREADRAARGAIHLRLSRLAALAAPLGLLAGAAALESSLPRFIVGQAVGAYELGILGVMLYSTLVGNMVVAAVAQAALPRLASLHDVGRLVEVRRLVGRLVRVAAGAGMVTVALAALVGRIGLKLAFGPEYAQWHGLLTLTAIAATFQFVCSTLSAVLRSTGRFRAALAVQIGTLTVTLSCCALGVAVAGLWGIGYAFVAAGALSSLLFARATRRELVQLDDNVPGNARTILGAA